ncbi:MAG TPA: hypothetical protein VEK08_03860 [Planctomycetota bacterium]|nr:hypothetical protein [Planctomycetota bacterium]
MFRMLLLLCAIALSHVHAGIPAEDLAKQEEFKKVYNSQYRQDHLAALEKLEGSTHVSTWQILSTVVSVNPFPEVRTAAFKRLSQMPATDPYLSQILVQHFQSLKPNDVDLRIAFAECMGNSEFKYAIFEAMSEYGSKMRYPEFLNLDGYRNEGGKAGSMNGTIGGDPNVFIGKQRAEFEKYLKIFNTITKANLSATDKNSPANLKSWWNENKNRVFVLDKNLLEKYKQEELERINKNSTLASKPGEKHAQPQPKKPSKDDE